jgi:4-hydroxybenzoate polyprenyltransferase
MAEVLLIYINVMVWIAVFGVAVFLAIYARTRPWQTTMGRHVLVFMTVLGLAFGYALVAPYLESLTRLMGWAVSLSAVSIAIWWRTAMIVNYQRKESRKEEIDAP